MMKYHIEHAEGMNQNALKDMVFSKMLTAPEAGLYSVINLAGTEIDFKEHLLDSMEQISVWLRNLKEHGYIDLDDQNKKITILQ